MSIEKIETQGGLKKHKQQTNGLENPFSCGLNHLRCNKHLHL